MSDINGLPPEILELILKSWHRDMMKREGEVDMGLAAVSLTCKRWKDLAFSTPELWSCIEIINDHSIGILSYSKVSNWLGRSKNKPLSLVIRGGCLRMHQSWLAAALLRLLVVHSHWWCCISLCFSLYFNPIKLPDNFLAPILESVTIEAPRCRENHVFYERLLRGAPVLQKFAHKGCDWAYFSPSGLHLEPLRCFDLGRSLSASNALMILEKGVNLQTCSLRIAGSDGPSAKPVTSSVGSLSLLVEGVDGPKEFFRFLDAQSPINLSITFRERRYDDHDTPCYILSETHSRLSTLTLTNVKIPEDKFLNCLTILSKLTTFRILKPLDVLSKRKPIENQINNNIKNLLTFQSEGTPRPLCPLLETITLELCVGADDGLFFEMVRSRHCSPDVLHKSGVALLKQLDAVLSLSSHSLDKEGLEKICGDRLLGSLKLLWSLVR